MKNTFTDLTNHLFAQLERLGDENIKGDALDVEVERARAITQVAGKAIEIGHLQLDAAKLVTEYPSAPRPAGLLTVASGGNGGGGGRR